MSKIQFSFPTASGKTPTQILAELEEKGVKGTKAVLKMMKDQAGDHMKLPGGIAECHVVKAGELPANPLNWGRMEAEAMKCERAPLSLEQALPVALKIVEDDLLPDLTTGTCHLTSGLGLCRLGDEVHFYVPRTASPKQTISGRDVGLFL